MTAGAGVSGTRAYIAARHFAWATPRRMRAITIMLLAIGLLASSVLVSGSSAGPTPARSSSADVQQH
jgi:hypothetical protein